jgi:outer membrane protein OmpA-like peptidoglycan-associated protein
MKITLPALLTLIFLLFVLTVRWLYVTRAKSPQQYSQVAAPQLPQRLKTLNLSDKDTSLLLHAEQFAFLNNDEAPILNPNNELTLRNITDYLHAQPKKKLIITGYFCPDEASIQPGYFENLGLARSAAVRDLLTRQGIAAERIALDGELSNERCQQQPLDFSFFTEADPVDHARAYYLFHDMTISAAHFSADGRQFLPGAAIKRYAAAVKDYLDESPRSTLYIVGHSNSGMADSSHFAQGMQLAQTAMTYFIDLGVPRGRLNCVSDGKKHPMADNTNTGGRKKNQRVNFILE